MLLSLTWHEVLQLIGFGYLKTNWFYFIEVLKNVENQILFQLYRIIILNHLLSKTIY